MPGDILVELLADSNEYVKICSSGNPNAPAQQQNYELEFDSMMTEKEDVLPSVPYGGYDDYMTLVVGFDSALSAIKEHLSTLETALEVAYGEIDYYVFESEDPEFEDESLRDALGEAKDKVSDYESESRDFEFEFNSFKSVLENPRLGFGNGLSGFQFTMDVLKDAIEETLEKGDDFESSLSDLEYALSDLESELGAARRRWSRTLNPVKVSLTNVKAALQIVKDGS